MMGVLTLILGFLILLQNFIKARITEHEAETSNSFGGGVVKMQKEKKKKRTFCHKFPV
jgi:hypothetical protein